MTEPGIRKVACALLLLGTMAGCRHKAPPPPPPVAIAAPPLTSSSITVITPLPSVPPEAKPNVAVAPAEKPAPVPTVVVPAKRTRRLRRKTPPAPAPVETAAIPGPAAVTPPPPAPSVAAPTPATPQPQNGTSAATHTEPAGDAVPAGTGSLTGTQPSSTAAIEAAPTLGELSAGTALGSGERTRMLGEIQRQEARLLKVKEPASSEARMVQMQVRSFLTKAKQAVAENDLDGAQTLNTKARVLLDELQSE